MKQERAKEQILEELQVLKTRLKELEKLQNEWELAEEELRKSEQDYKARTQSIYDIIYEVDVDGCFIFISNSIEQLGYKPKELIGKHFSLIIYPDDVESVSRVVVLPRFQGKVTGDEASPKLFDERRTGKRMTRYLELRLVPKKKEENYRYAELHSSGKWLSVDNKANKLVGSIGIIRDITRRKQAEGRLNRTYQKMKVLYQDLEQKNKEFQRLNQLKSDFVSNASHEIKTPLAIIKESVGLFLDQMSEGLVEEQKKILIMTQENISRLTNIVDSLLDVSKIEAGKLELDKEYMNIAGVIPEMISEFKYLADKKQIRLEYRVSGDEITIFCDQEKIRRVLVNLISNAIKFTPQRGRITLICEDKENEVLVSVEDTGSGIAEKDIPKLFDKFTQFSKKTEPGERGTGLGLAITKGIIEEHKGCIWVESELNQGSRFYFALPRLSFDDIFKEYLAKEIGVAKTRRSYFSVIILGIKDVIPGQDKILPSVERIVKDTLRRKNDIVFKGKKEVFIILPDTDKQSTLLVLSRIKENLEQFFTSRGELKERVSFLDAVITYPGEAKNVDEILNKLRQANEDRK